jgi:hypothetical protein
MDFLIALGHDVEIRVKRTRTRRSAAGPLIVL